MGSCSSQSVNLSSMEATTIARDPPENVVLPENLPVFAPPTAAVEESTEVDAGSPGRLKQSAKLESQPIQPMETPTELPQDYSTIEAPTSAVVTKSPKTPRIQFAELDEQKNSPLKDDSHLYTRALPFVLQHHSKGMMRIEKTKKFAAFCMPAPVEPGRHEDKSTSNACNLVSPNRPKSLNRQASRKIVYLRNTLKKLSLMDIAADISDDTSSYNGASPVKSPVPASTSIPTPMSPITSPVNPNENGASLLSLENSCDFKLCSLCRSQQLKGLSCLCTHFLCTECFCSRVSSMCSQPEVLRKHDFAIFCPVEDCESPPWNSYHVRKLLDGPTLQLYLDTLVDVCKVAGLGVRGGGAGNGEGSQSSPTKQRVRLGSDEVSSVKYLMETTEVLRTQLRRLNVTPMEYIPLPEIQAELQEIFNNLNNDMPYDEKRMDYLLMCMENNPVYCAEKEETARQWRREMDNFTAECLATMRGYVPVHIFEASLQSLQEDDGLTLELAKRLLSKKCLWLVRMRVVDIERIHEVELMGRFNPIAQGLDIVELAAVYAAVPERFANDPSGRKAQWRLNLENALRDMDKLRQTKSLLGSKARHPCYKKQKPDVPFLHRHSLRCMEAVQSSLNAE